MISSAKAHQNEMQLKQLKPFRAKLTEIMGHILGAQENFESPLIESREVMNAAVVVYGSDDGLCGAYNINIFKGLLIQLDKLRRDCPGAAITVIPVGQKIARAVSKLDGVKVEIPEGVDSKMGGPKVTEFTEDLRDRFVKGTIDRVDVIYMKYKSMSKQTLTADRLFPVEQASLIDGIEADENQLYIFEPDPNSIFNDVRTVDHAGDHHREPCQRAGGARDGHADGQRQRPEAARRTPAGVQQAAPAEHHGRIA